MISIIIPAFNEAKTLPTLLMYLNRVPFIEHITEIIVSDANSSDDTATIAASYGAIVFRTNDKGRAQQMNSAARTAKGKILYFLHADSLPPRDFVHQIVNHYTNGIQSGCFRLQYDSAHWFLRMNAWFTRFNVNWFRFGDQSLFIASELFQDIGGFREDFLMMEDQEIIRRIKGRAEFVVVPRYITTSARKYIENGIYRLQCIYYYIFALYSFGVSQPLLLRAYEHLLEQKPGAD
jgi:rSAM/selenodomain-associated transferase 2